MDTVVFDIETQNFFTDPGVGWNNFDALKISVVGIYSYAKDEHVCFEESEMKQVAEFFGGAERIVGFGMNRYDIPVLHRYLGPFRGRHDVDLWRKERIDLLEEVEMATGERISLEKLALANLGVGKTGHGAHAIELYRDGRLEELKAYCTNDVELTKKLYDIMRIKGELAVPRRDRGDMQTVTFKNFERHGSLL